MFTPQILILDEELESSTEVNNLIIHQNQRRERYMVAITLKQLLLKTGKSDTIGEVYKLNHKIQISHSEVEE